MPDLAAPLQVFAAALTRSFGSPVPGDPEDQLKAPVAALLEAAGALSGRAVVARTESRVRGLGARPDLGVDVGGLLCGHVELKAPGRGARPERLRDEHDRRQWERFQRLPNLIYTDSLEWSLYQGGKAVERLRLSFDPTGDGAGAVTPDDARRLEALLRAFLGWDPVVPANPRELAAFLAPLCRLLKDEVAAAAAVEGSVLARVSRDWRDLLFPDADEPAFADAYAQTLTYGLLLARLDGLAPERFDVDAAFLHLRAGHALLAQALLLLADPEVRSEIGLPVDLLERSLRAVDPAALSRGARGHDPWLYFYEDFLAAYDPALRKARGVYYTPPEVVGAQVRLVGDVLDRSFGKVLGAADDGVIVLDPAAGTGTYLLALIEDGLQRARRVEGESGRAVTLAANLRGFEILVGPYTVAHLRVSEALRAAGAAGERVEVLLTDTLESPGAPEDSAQVPVPLRALGLERTRARRVKAHDRVIVCIGNPPYDRQAISRAQVGTESRKGGWIRYGDGGPAPLDDYLAPLRRAGLGVHAKNLFDDYVYFWRWATWKVLEQEPGPGVVCFITCASFLRGVGFAGMREHLRRSFDELWVLDLGGDSKGSRPEQNVFDIRVPVAIALAVRHGGERRAPLAAVRYRRIRGSRAEKLAALDAIQGLDPADAWEPCPEVAAAPFVPAREGTFSTWPDPRDLFPWQHSGVEFKRTWPIGVTREALDRRWEAFVAEPDAAARARLFVATRDRSVDSAVRDPLLDIPLPALGDLNPASAHRGAVPLGHRSFDRQWALLDPRLCDYPRPPLLRVAGPAQVFLTSIFNHPLGSGPAAVATPHLPDRHHFRGSYGGKDVLPLWRDAAGTVPNVTAGLLDALTHRCRTDVTPRRLFAYVYGVLCSPAYTARFADDLAEDVPRVPITTDPMLFEAVAALGERLLWLHCRGERWVQTTRWHTFRGAARCLVAVPSSAEGYPEAFAFDAAAGTLQVGEGRFGPVSEAVWSYEVSGFPVVRSWLGYRMREKRGKASSALDRIQPERWTAALTHELLELLWVLEETIRLHGDQEALLARIVEGPCVAAAGLPIPTAAERAPPEAGEEGATPVARQLLLAMEPPLRYDGPGGE